MEKVIIDNSGISRLLDLAKSARQRKIARLYYVNNMSVNEICDQIGCNSVIALSDIAVINKLIEDNIKSKLCVECGKAFYTDSNNHKCPICKNNRKKAADLLQREMYRSVKSIEPKRPKKRKFKPLQVIEKERAEYNRTHSTLLSYGQYVDMVGE